MTVQLQHDCPVSEIMGVRGVLFVCLFLCLSDAGKHSRHVDLALMGSGFPVILTFKPGRVINFKDCYLGEQTQVVCTMKNESEFLPVTFKFRKAAHFNVSPERGILKTKSEKVTPSFS